MRVIAGSLGGRQFDSPKSPRTHPMSDKMRGALFNVLGELDGLTVLDAFAGSGALGFEAISRGAALVTALDNDRSAQATIVANARLLGLDKQVRLIKASVNAWLQTAGDQLFDIVLCDPPYDDLQLDTIQHLSRCVIANGLFIVSWPGNHEPLLVDNLAQIERRSYGDAQLIFYRKT